MYENSRVPPLGVDPAIGELCYNGTILQMNYRKMTIFIIIFL